jgi:hypothetical protein
MSEPTGPPNRYVRIACPSGKHKRSMVTFRDHAVAAMFCVPCEHAWTEQTTHPELRAIAIDHWGQIDNSTQRS